MDTYQWVTYGGVGLIIVGTVIIAWLWNRLFGRFIRRSTLVIRNDPTNYKFLQHAVTALIYIVGFAWAIYSISSLRTLASSLLAGAGILAIAVGFASQHALSNIVGGMFIIVFKPFRVNDRIRFQSGTTGVVEDITLRHTVIRDFENVRIVIPNSVISDEVIINNDFEDERICKWVEFDISYDSDIDLARRIIREEALKHPLYIDGRTQEQIDKGSIEVPVRVISLGDFSVRLKAWVWANDYSDAFIIKGDLLESVKKRFDKEGVEIPFPYRTVVYKKDIMKPYSEP